MSRNATYEDLFDLPDNVVGEILAGQLVTQPRPAPRHALAAMAVGAALFSEFGRKSKSGNESDWWILYEPECHLEADIVVPDIAGWRKSTMPEIPDAAWFNIRPDWVCEVLSPSTAKQDRGVKREIYAREGVGYYWIIDPVEQLIEVFVLNDGSWVLANTAVGDKTVHLVPFGLSVLWV